MSQKLNLNIVLLEPFFSGSHQQWAEGLQKYSQHNIEILSLPGRHWKWRMHGGAVSLAEQFNRRKDSPDLILATSMLDFSTFLGLIKERAVGIPTAIYFHENQLTYPWSPQDRDVKHKRDNHYAFMNYTSALVADRVFFNSEYHRSSFLEALPKFLNQFPDRQDKHNIEEIEVKSEVLYLGMDLTRFDAYQSKKEINDPIILWNHRWEYDKNPEVFFEALFRLNDEHVPFKLIVLGEKNQMNPPIFDEAKDRLKDCIIHWGFVQSFEEYAQLLWKADILPVTSNQDFFGGSVVEAMYCECFPILPNRLAYPEHLTKDLYDQCLYQEGDFYSKLKEVVNRNANESFKSWVKKYDWQDVISDYDEMFLKFCS
ncbi:MAG: DUF3524 domain-containing protein [Cyanothece sp. SIO1E1]|nr:DUF3524 domain-containing protein [Cyanothece sp. SIO1E1]